MCAGVTCNNIFSNSELTNELSPFLPGETFISVYLKLLFFNLSENSEDANSESQLQINAVESSEQSTHRDSDLLVCIYMCVCVCVRVYVCACVYVCVCVCVYVF